MAEVQTEWLQSRKETLGVADKAIAAAIGRDRTIVTKLINGTMPFDFKYLDGFASALQMGKIDVLYRFGVLDEPGNQNDPAPASPPPLSEDEVDIQQWDIAYGMGGGTYLDLPVTGETHRFSRSWLRQFTHAPPERIFLATGTGDSMMPTILDADIVIVDTSQTEVRLADKIWAAAYGQTGIIKRLRPMPDGSVKILSDNPNVPPETAYDGELNVVGRVVAIVRKT